MIDSKEIFNQQSVCTSSDSYLNNSKCPFVTLNVILNVTTLEFTYENGAAKAMSSMFLICN